MPIVYTTAHNSQSHDAPSSAGALGRVVSALLVPLFHPFVLGVNVVG